jgi:hypothetical protein
MKLAKSMVEHALSPKRVSLIRVNAFVEWLRKNKPDVLREATKALGVKECQEAFDDLSAGTLLWR